MKTKIKDLKKGQEAVISGSITKKPKTKTKGEPWILLVFTDNSGTCYAKIWNNLELYPTIKEMPDGVTIEATVKCTEAGQYINVEIRSFEIVEKKEVGLIDVDGLKAELRDALSGLKDEKLKKLIKAVFSRPDMNEAYFKAPATMMSGYSFEGGVLAFVVRSIRLIKSVAAVFNEWNHNSDHFVTKINEDFLTAACILEPIGRVRAYKFNGNRVEKTVEGELFEASYLTMKIFFEEVEKIEFPDEQRLILEHVLGSAMGRSDWGALHIPRSREAVAFNIILNLNLQMGHFEFLDRSADATDQFVKLFQKTMFLGSYDEKGA
ncbi:metal-dependent phosphohydrolase [Brevibacillus sp. NPDC058079]|uniref:metal-dependent phosphohydrolase n=1 Tax=Brevibacillus sp. NPDC058079 TaxID=3346330 RepID=UPI0036ED6F00